MTSESLSPLILLAGPTASGKSALALALADAVDGTVINADSMQVYRDLRVLTARPTAADEARVPHRLYGYLDGAEVGTAARWAETAACAVQETWTAGRLPIVVGGSGLYLRALTEGLAPMPDIPADVRAAARARLEMIGNAAFHAELAARDPEMAARLDPGNSQRLARAWEVLEATGRSLAWWQLQPPPAPPLRARRLTLVLDPDPTGLRARIDARFEAMMAVGALEEVAALAARGLPPDRPVMKAVGVPDLLAHLRGETDRPTAVARAQAASRQYAKRQRTWLRHQVQADVVLRPESAGAQDPESLARESIPIVRRFLLTR